MLPYGTYPPPPRPRELIRRVRHAPNLVEVRRWQLLALVADGKSVKVAADLIGMYPPYARRIVHRYNDDGPNGGSIVVRLPSRPVVLGCS